MNLENIPTPITDRVASHEGNWDTKALRMGACSRYLERHLAVAMQWVYACPVENQNRADMIASYEKLTAPKQ